MTDARRLAVDLLVRVDGGAFVHALLPTALRAGDLDDRDRAFVTELVSGTVRLRGALDFLLDGFVDRPLAELDPRVRAGLRLGAYQLVAGVAPHAAVGATVGAVGGRARGYVNAVLRRLAGSGPPWPWPEGDDPEALAVRTSHPRWLVEWLVADLGVEDAAGLLEADNVAPALTLRPNRSRTTGAELAAEVAGEGASTRPGRLVPEAVVVRGGGDPARSVAVVEGRATPQDEASQSVAALMEVRPGERVLEVGAAPGGKATALAEWGATVVGLDVDRGRLRMLAGSAARLGLTPGSNGGSLEGRVAPVAADGRRLPFPDEAFDRVLVDAPCSGLGVLRRRPDARWNAVPEDVPALAALQRELLVEAARTVVPGGLLAYSVCTLTAAETVAVDEWLREVRPDLDPLAPPPAPWQPVGRGARLLPQARGTDGMYLLRLRVPDPPRARGGGRYSVPVSGER